MMTIEIWLSITLLVSLIGNALLFWFSREQSRRLVIVSENLNDLMSLVSNYREHLRKVYTLDAFYGDETLEHLMEHTRSLSELLGEQYGDIISVTDPIEYEIEEEKQIEESKEQDVLYAGTREGNT